MNVCSECVCFQKSLRVWVVVCVCVLGLSCGEWLHEGPLQQPSWRPGPGRPSVDEQGPALGNQGGGVRLVTSGVRAKQYKRPRQLAPCVHQSTTAEGRGHKPTRAQH